MSNSQFLPKAVFINCPFDGEYLPLFQSMVFTVVRCGFQPRCALEVSNAAQARIEKIAGIIKECPIGIHDISRTELDDANGLPRFNMPLELGLYLGARYYGGARHKDKVCLILDRERYRYQKFISDIAGQDISAHGDACQSAMKVVRNFLNEHNGPRPLPDGEVIWTDYVELLSVLPTICKRLEVVHDSLEYQDFLYIVTEYISEDKPDNAQGQKSE